MMRLLRGMLTTIAFLLFATPGALAQPAAAATAPSAGWTLRPSLAVASAWDDDVLLRGDRDETRSDLVSSVAPRAEIDFLGRRGQFAASYSGAFRIHRDLGSLNSYDQHASLSAQRTVSRRVSLFARNTVAVAPTTELAELAGIPFMRTGSTMEMLSGGAEAVLSKRTSLVAAYTFQAVRFNGRDAVADLLRGGHSHGGSASLKHVITTRTALTADYSIQRADVADGAEAFDVQNTSVGAEHRLSEAVRVYGAVGISRLGVTEFTGPRTGPSVRAGLTRQFRTAGIDVSYGRRFVPSFGFGGTNQNEDLAARLRVALSPSVHTRGAVSWQRNDPLTAGGLSLRSRLVDLAIGYAFQPWAQIEAFFGHTSQTINRPGGSLSRNRIGFQIVTTKPMRIR
jgi:hypothetical protein